VNTNMLLALALGAWALLRGKPAAAAPAPAASAPPRPRLQPAAPAPDRVVRVPEVLVTAPVPLTTTQPVSAKSVPWPQVEEKILNRPATQSTKREAVPAFNISKTATAEPQNEFAAMVTRERNPFDSSYWMPAKKVVPPEVEQAKAYMSIWQKGGVWYDGPRTFAGRRQYRAVEQGGKKAVTIWQAKPPFGNESSAPTRAATSAPGSSAPTLRQGSQGNDVAYLQKLLGLAQDGKFGPNTKAAVVAFQKSKKLTPDGIVGRQTWTALGAFQ